MSSSAERLRSFYAHLERLQHLQSIQHLLEWDQSIWLPEKARAVRAEQIAFMEGEYYRSLREPDFIELLEELQQQSAGLSDADRSNLAHTAQKLQREREVPLQLLTQLASQKSKTHSAWLAAKKSADFSLVRDELQLLVSLSRERAEAIADGATLYERLFRDYEPKGTWSEARDRVCALHEQAIAMRESGSLRHREKRAEAIAALNKDVQRELCARICRLVQLDPDASRLDESAHPFQSTLGPYDQRLTTRYSDDEPFDALFSTLHECGHALYAQLRPKQWFGTGLGSAASYSIDESQSRFWENGFGRSDLFLQVLQQELVSLGVTLEYDELLSECRALLPAAVRVETDEIHYLSHIWLRTELEEALFSGQLGVDDLPEAWADRMQRYLQYSPKNESEGVLQDIHWYIGAYGYFPTYSLGSSYAMQFVRELLPAPENVASCSDPRARMQELVRHCQQWFETHIACHGAAKSSEELISTAVSSAESYREDFGSYCKQRYALDFGR